MDDNEIMTQKGKEKVREGEEESASTKCKRKRIKGSNGEYHEDSPSRMVRRRLIESLSPYKAVADILKRVRRSVKEDWIVGGEFNAIINDTEKEGGRR
ncbi:hypothetical protein Gohar_004597, partial [Gossypium harknessii]|nr:hypothetical protein [Gossypium harknessii]